MDMSSWSNDSMAHTRICVLESQVEVKENRLLAVETENRLLKEEIKRLKKLVDALNKGNINSNEDVLDRFK